MNRRRFDFSISFAPFGILRCLECTHKPTKERDRETEKKANNNPNVYDPKGKNIERRARERESERKRHTEPNVSIIYTRSQVYFYFGCI